MRLGFEESVAIVADFLYPGQPQVQQIISPTSVLAGHVLWSRFLPRGSSPGILSEEERLGGSGGATGAGIPDFCLWRGCLMLRGVRGVFP